MIDFADCWLLITCYFILKDLRDHMADHCRVQICLAIFVLNDLTHLYSLYIYCWRLYGSPVWSWEGVKISALFVFTSISHFVIYWIIWEPLRVSIFDQSSVYFVFIFFKFLWITWLIMGGLQTSSALFAFITLSHLIIFWIIRESLTEKTRIKCEPTRAGARPVNFHGRAE